MKNGPRDWIQGTWNCFQLCISPFSLTHDAILIYFIFRHRSNGVLSFSSEYLASEAPAKASQRTLFFWTKKRLLHIADSVWWMMNPMDCLLRPVCFFLSHWYFICTNWHPLRPQLLWKRAAVAKDLANSSWLLQKSKLYGTIHESSTEISGVRINLWPRSEHKILTSFLLSSKEWEVGTVFVDPR